MNFYLLLQSCDFDRLCDELNHLRKEKDESLDDFSSRFMHLYYQFPFNDMPPIDECFLYLLNEHDQLNINQPESNPNANLHHDLDSLEKPENIKGMHALGSLCSTGDVNEKEHVFQTMTPMIFYSPMSSSDESETSSIDNLDSCICKEMEEENFLRTKDNFSDPNSMTFVSEIEENIPIDHDSKLQLKSPMQFSLGNKMLFDDCACEIVSLARD